MSVDNAVISKVYFICSCKNLDFTSAKGRKKKMDRALMDSTDDTTSAERPKKADLVSSPTDGEIDNFYKKLSKCSNKAAIINYSIFSLNPHSQAFHSPNIKGYS